jgi:hypothetical protein
VEAVYEDIAINVVCLTATIMGEGFEDVDEQRIEKTFPLPPLPRLSVIKEANLRQETPAMIHDHHISLTQENLLNVSERLNHDIENNQSFQPSNVHPLFTSGKCQWIGCETHCQTFHGFLHHLQRDHHLVREVLPRPRFRCRWWTSWSNRGQGEGQAGGNGPAFESI